MANKKGKGADKAAFNSCFNNGKYNPWGKDSKKNPTNSSQTTGP